AVRLPVGDCAREVDEGAVRGGPGGAAAREVHDPGSLQEADPAPRDRSVRRGGRRWRVPLRRARRKEASPASRRHDSVRVAVQNFHQGSGFLGGTPNPEFIWPAVRPTRPLAWESGVTIALV